MNTLVTLHQQAFYLKHIVVPSWEQTNQITLYSITSNTNLHSRPSWIINSQAKGFGRNTSNNTPMQKKNTSSSTPKSGSTQEDDNDNDNDDDRIPQVVFDRMIRRILISVGAPMGMGVATLLLLGLLKDKQIWDVPLWVPFLTTFVFFGSSVLGVAYGSLSTSWDAEKKGSLLGLDEAKENWVEMWKEDVDNN